MTCPFIPNLLAFLTFSTAFHYLLMYTGWFPPLPCSAQPPPAQDIGHADNSCKTQKNGCALYRRFLEITSFIKNDGGQRGPGSQRH